MKVKHFFSGVDSDRIVRAIEKAEASSSGEIRVHVTRSDPEDVEDAARKRFAKMGMAVTRERNGVLFYIAPKAQKFHIVGDQAVHEKCGTDFWKATADEMSAAFRRGDFTGGLIAGVDRIGEVLKAHFPSSAENPNEQPDYIDED
jgi:uncharacterized membrane protein